MASAWSGFVTHCPGIEKRYLNSQLSFVVIPNLPNCPCMPRLVAMFTGLVEETGIIQQIKRGKDSIELLVGAKTCASGVKVGDSLAVNGCCLTVARLLSRGKNKSMRFDLLNETWNRTNLQFLKAGSPVNLERSLLANSRIGGHFVTGHIDGLGKIVEWERRGKDHLLEITAPLGLMRYVVKKGSIAIDGVSLTVATVRKSSFGIWIIPHTLKMTAFRQHKVGEAVNIEVDILGKYVEKFVTSQAAD
jgi:riboflavin synthase